MRHHILFIRAVQSRIGLALAMVIVSIFGAWLNAIADESLPSAAPDFPSVIRAYSDQLAKMESDKGAINLFVSAIGPALQMGDVTRTLGANPLPAKLAKELLVPDLTAAVHRLMGSLAAWHLASTIRQAVRDQQLATVTERLSGSSQARAWLDQQEKASWHDSLNQLSDVVASPEWARGNQGESASTLLVTVLERATRLEVDAMQASYQEWDRIRNWKDRVRGLRGQARLCGTWQWIIHNHQQHHQEQKLSLLFPPAGNTQATLPGLVETIVLGENVYLRWEIDGRVQEDSLQFSKEGQRLEGTFMNSQGGWGSISGKRTAGCTP
ncbi:MAG: hypothetical protein KGS09_17265 [Nitrospirae bacterium]|nr:hypothetical protein [Nitrospirota bacterium]MDE3040679.1 hypothetical protein [Nitrospirota bacterium]MDE3221327.1 hypothetical protein [Nitrospirota bacterium]